MYDLCRLRHLVVRRRDKTDGRVGLGRVGCNSHCLV